MWRTRRGKVSFEKEPIEPVCFLLFETNIGCFQNAFLVVKRIRNHPQFSVFLGIYTSGDPSMVG
jgi:hypothetical protein